MYIMGSIWWYSGNGTTWGKGKQFWYNGNANFSGDIFCSGNISKTENGDTMGLTIKKRAITPLIKWNTMVYTGEALDNIMRYNT